MPNLKHKVIMGVSKSQYEAAKGMLFTPTMALANVKGHKWETRRLNGLDYLNENPDVWGQVPLRNEETRAVFNVMGREVEFKHPYKPGEIVYQKEPVYKGGDGMAYYEACNSPVVRFTDQGTYMLGWDKRWKRNKQPAMFMPKIYARLFMEVKEVYLTRLQCIGWENAKDEGMELVEPFATINGRLRAVFAEYIQKITPGAFDKNYWCRVIKYAPK